MLQEAIANTDRNIQKESLSQKIESTMKKQTETLELKNIIAKLKIH
jgi:hypothetical protein